jgi:hemerythrin superfamily protein
MATTQANKTRTKTSEGDSSRARGDGERSAFFGGQTGMLLGAAAAGVAVGLAANMGRKMWMQLPSVSGSWDESLKQEHAMTLAVFDLLEETADDATTSRTALVKKLKYALTKHAVAEENAVYPALREAGLVADADELNSEHGYVKNFLYELDSMPKDSPGFLPKVREFRALIEDHIRTEEDELFPRLKGQLSEEENKQLTYVMGRENFKMA